VHQYDSISEYTTPAIETLSSCRLTLQVLKSQKIFIKTIGATMKTIQPFCFTLMVVAVSLCHGLSLSSQTSTSSRIRSSLSPGSPGLFPSSTQLHESVTTPSGGGASKSYEKVDWKAVAVYPLGLVAQVSLMFVFLAGVDKVVAHFSLKVPFVANAIFLYAFNLKSALFSILPNKRDDGRKMKQENWEYNKRNIPSWTPPGIAFVFGWPLFTFGLRAYTGAMVVKSTGHFACPAIMSLMLHLSTGSLWNTVNNVERRLGVSVILLYSLWLTKAFAALMFYKVDPMAGKLLALTLTWLTAACALETRTWQINPDPNTGKPEPLIPMQHPKWTTKFRWEE